MAPLMKLDLWLLRWAILFLVIFAPFAGALFYTDYSVTGFVIIFILALTLTQTDDKHKTRRFMLSLPLPLKTFFQARALVVMLIGVIWIVLEGFGRMIGFGDADFSEILFHASAQLATMFVLTPSVIALLTLLKHPVMKWGVTFIFYMMVVMIGTMMGVFVTEIFNYMEALGYALAGVLLIVGLITFWLILMLANAIRSRVDLV
ncbi:ABC-2 transporter permease [Salicibibacter cibarius]|uniref:ABC-2 transporter permease n=1 Tax=Salicibibacter cibarius TaxID=2743000 RepID=A0A7T7CCY5_9BACI|nr:ABC-2 transporter permease [Salicibibacter cibarius]QQK77405.1 ABC-2 transporter permease [Salicibibacter cibarius]